MNGTQSDVNSVWRALNRTDGQLVRLSRGVWTEVNSTKDDLQRLRNATHNITDQVTTKFMGFWLDSKHRILGNRKIVNTNHATICIQSFLFGI